MVFVDMFNSVVNWVDIFVFLMCEVVSCIFNLCIVSWF